MCKEPNQQGTPQDINNFLIACAQLRLHVNRDHVQGVHQLYQALAWLEPPEGSQQMEAWSNLRSRLHRLAQEPPLVKLILPGHHELCAALAQHQLPCRAQMLWRRYSADAASTARNSTAAQVILMLQRPQDCFTNASSR